MNRSRRAAPVLAALAVFVVAVPTLDARGGSADDEGVGILARARSAALSRDYAGTVRVEWQGADGPHTAEVQVRSDDGVLYVDGERDVVAADSERFVEGAGGWALVSGPNDVGELPDPTDDWEFRVVDGPRVVDAPTRVVEIRDRDSGLIRQRVYVAPGSFIVRREILDVDGDPYRVVEFVDFRRRGPAPTAPRDYDHDQPEDVATLPDDVPQEIGDGFELVDASEHEGGTVQLVYSDGVFVVSVFVAEGELDAGALPSGATTRDIEGEEVRAYTTASSDVLVWEDDDDRVIAWVSDAPPDAMAGAAASFTGGDDPGVLSRAADLVLGPFSWR